MKLSCRGAKRWAAVLWVVLLILGVEVAGQTQQLPPLVPDRPGFYCGSQAVLPGVFHIEAGVAYERLTSGSSREESVLAPFLLRLGLFSNVELRVASAGVPTSEERVAGRVVSASGFSSPSVGVKWQFAEGGERAAQPSMAVLFSLNLPAGSRAFRPDKVEPTLNFASDFSVGKQTTLSTNIAVIAPYDAEREEYFSELFFAVALGRSMTQRSAWFVEVAGAAPRFERAGTVVLLDGGVTYLLSNDLQLDVSLTRGLNGNSPDWIAAGGISIRFY